jgi:nicotinate-nucleotide pyrophosphorylase (carboxylating)
MSAVPTADPLPLYPLQYESLVRAALLEDLGRAGDITTNAIVPPDARATGYLMARRAGRLAGLQVAATAFQLTDPAADIAFLRHDGDVVEADEKLAVIRGSARGLLSAERVALNFLGRLSGIASTTQGLVRAVQGYATRVVCTRKTIPGLRMLEKYAVRCGGGANHRFGLDDAVLIKDNHLIVSGGITEAVRRVHASVGHLVKVEVEVDTLAQLEEALSCRIDAVLLDNMPPERLAEAVAMVGARILTEASGGITPETAREVAAAGVDLLSAGWITHSAAALDVALDVTGLGA